MGYAANQIIFAVSPADEGSIAAAKTWIKDRHLTPQQVSIRKSEHFVYIIAKEKIE